MAESLRLQNEYRETSYDLTMIGDQEAGVVNYLHDQTVKGETVTTKHIEFIFVGQFYLYHLDFRAPVDQSEAYRELFEAIAEQFTFLKTNLWEQFG